MWSSASYFLRQTRSAPLGEGRAGGIPPAPPSPAVPPPLPLPEERQSLLFPGSPGRSPCRPARRDYLLSARGFLRVQVAVSPPSMLNSDSRNSGSRRPRGDPAPLILQGGCGRSTSGPGAGTTGGAPSHQREAASTGTAVIPVVLREDEPKGEIVPHLGPRLRPGAGAGAAEPALHTPPVPRYRRGGRGEATAKTNTASFRKRHQPPLLIHGHSVHLSKTRGKGLRIAIFRRNAEK